MSLTPEIPDRTRRSAAASTAAPGTMTRERQKPDPSRTGRSAKTDAAPRAVNAHRPEIDGMRSLAVMWVVFYHAVPLRFPGGFIGVDIFFVISGYLISGILLREMHKGTYSLADFYFRRCRRILPALTVVLVTTWLIGWFTLFSNDFASLGQHVAASSLFVSNILLWSEAGYFDVAAELKPLLHFWSLGVEEQFYLIWPLILMGIFAFKRVGLITLAIAVLFGVSFVINIGGIQADPSATFYLLPSRFWELLTGAGIAWFEFRRPGQQLSAMLTGGRQQLAAELTGTLGLALILVGTVLIDGMTPFPGWYALLPVFGSAMLIHAGQGAWINRRIFSLRPLVLIGLISYPLYLWHWPLLSFMHLVNGGDDGSTTARLFKYGLVALSFVLAWLTWQFVEKPVQRMTARMRKDSGRERPALLASAVVIALLGLGGWATWKAGGFPTRFPESAELRQFHYEPATDYREGDCFLRYTQSAAEFGRDCLPRPRGATPGAVGSAAADATSGSTAAGRPQIVLWGDSHAAHLALGLREQSAALGADFAQLTASACPPLLNFYRSNRPFCPGVVDFALKQITASQPDVVIVGGAWYGVDAGVMATELPHTVQLLKQAGVKQVIVVGPFPEWLPTLPRAMQAYYREHQQLPERTNFELKTSLPMLDQTIRGFVREQPMQYVSPREVLCNAEGCLTGPTSSGFALMSYDSSHLTDSGSRLFVERALTPLLRTALGR